MLTDQEMLDLLPTITLKGETEAKQQVWFTRKEVLAYGRKVEEFLKDKLEQERQHDQ